MKDFQDVMGKDQLSSDSDQRSETSHSTQESVNAGDTDENSVSLDNVQDELTDVDFHSIIDNKTQEVVKLLEDYTFQQRYDWILKKKDEGNEAFRKGYHYSAVGFWISALCAFDFGRKEYEPMSQEKQDNVNFNLKIPILNNMALLFIVKAQEYSNDLKEKGNEKTTRMLKTKTDTQCVELHDSYMERSKSLLEQVLKIDQVNEKALMRKCNVLLALGQKFEPILKNLQDVAFQSEKSAALYKELQYLQGELKDLEESRRQRVKRIRNNYILAVTPVSEKPQLKPSPNGTLKNKINDVVRKKEDDWFFIHKKEQERKRKIEDQYIKSLNPISKFVYLNIYSKCCKSRGRKKYFINEKFKQKME